MSGAQGKAAEIAGAASIIAEVDDSRIDTRYTQGWVSHRTDSLEEATKIALEHQKAGKPCAVAYCGNIVDLLEYLYEHNVHVDLMSDQTSCHVPYDGGYCPQGLTFAQRTEMLDKDPEGFRKLVDKTLQHHYEMICKFHERGTYFFDYGNSFLKAVYDTGVKSICKNGENDLDGFIFPSYVEDILGPCLFDFGYGPFRWCCLSRNPEDLHKTDMAAAEYIKAHNRRYQDYDNYVWVRDAEKNKLVVGTQCRILYQDAMGRMNLALKFNEMVRNGEIGPVILGRDHHDTGGTDAPFRETSNIKDGSNIMAEMATQCYAGNAARGMSYIALHNGGGTGIGRADGSVDRRLTNGHINITYTIERKKKVEETKQLKKVFSLNYETSCDPVNPNRLLSVRDDSNPLSITLGNPSLKHGRHHYFNVRGSLSLPSTAYVGFHANFELYHNAVAMGYAYNERTGAYTYRPENVDGNRRAYAYLSYSSPLGQKHIYEFSGSTRWSMNHSVDIIDTRLSTVDNHSLDQRLELTARWNDRVTLKLSGNVAWQYATSERENYHTRNTWDLNYGPEFRVKLLADLQLHTTLSVFQRRGYDDSSMNSTEMVWNANLEWNFDFRRSSYARSATAADAPAKSGPRPWTLSVKAHDLLQQLSNTHRVLNAQGITETWYNTVPSYLMLSLTYRFAQLPKKKQ